MLPGLGSAVDISKDDILSAPSEMYTIVFAPSTTTVELVILLLKNVDWFCCVINNRFSQGTSRTTPQQPTTRIRKSASGNWKTKK